MPKHYTEEFKSKAVALVLEHQYTAKRAGENLGVHPTTIKYWVRDHRSKHGTPKSLQAIDQTKYVEQLEREVRELRMERDILKKATAYFARDQR